MPTGLDDAVLWLSMPDGKSFKWDGLTTAQIIDDNSSESNELYATIKNTDEMTFEAEFNISRNFEYYMLVGTNRRLVRRARRWYEKLRRKELKEHRHIQNKTYLAAQNARFASNNSKKKKQVFTVMLEGEKIYV